MALVPCKECKRKVSTEATTCPHCGVSNPAEKPKAMEKRAGTSRVLKVTLVLAGLGIISSIVLRDKPAPASSMSSPAPAAAIEAVKPAEGSPAEVAIRTQAESIKAGMGGQPEVQTEQLRFAANALEALQCVERKSPCTTFVLESHLKGLPIGWIERVLGPPDSEQRLNGQHLYYWSLSLDEDGRRRTYRLQLEFGGSCPLTVNKGQAACTFNFYG